jgi:hypothetical protein
MRAISEGRGVFNKNHYCLVNQTKYTKHPVQYKSMSQENKKMRRGGCLLEKL